MADVKVRDEFRAKFKIAHSYDHLVSTSGQCDASINKISRYCTPSLNILLFGDEHLNHNNNLAIFIDIQKYIFESKRFKSLESLSLSLSCCLDMYIGLNDAEECVTLLRLLSCHRVIVIYLSRETDSHKPYGSFLNPQIYELYCVYIYVEFI